MASTISAGTTAGTAIVVAGDTSGSLALRTNGTTTAVTIDTSQNVGIGTTSPATKLDVNGNIAVGSITCRAGGGEGGQISLNNTTDTATAYNFDVDGSNHGRLFTTQNNTNLSLGTLAGTGGVIVLYTAATERMRIDSSGNLLFNSGYGSAATAYGCRAWCNFNGTGTVAIRASGNVSSITDNGTGDYTVNFTTAMPDVNYVATFGPVTRAGADSNCMIRYSNGMGTYTLTTTTYRFGAGDIAGALVAQDPVSVLVAFHR